MKYPVIHNHYNSDNSINDEQGEAISQISAYWQWAHSDLLDNTERGIFAEYIVAKAVNAKEQHRINWSKYDLTTEEGITLEVKSASYIQTWGQEKHSSIRFAISKTLAYDEVKGRYDGISKRQAQVYVFCLLREKDQERVNALDLNQWIFYILSTKEIENSEKYKDAKSISLKGIKELNATECSYSEIHEIIKERPQCRPISITTQSVKSI